MDNRTARFVNNPQPTKPTAGSRPLLLPVAWLLPAAATLLLRLLAPAQLVEEYYSRRAFLGVRTVLDATVSRLPFPLFYLFWFILLAVVVSAVRRTLRNGWSWRSFLYRSTRLLSILLLLFLWLWGFNYGRVPVEAGIGFERYQPTVDELRDRVYASAADLSAYRKKITRDTHALDDAHFPSDLEESIRPLVVAALHHQGYPAAGKPRGWQLLPKGILLRLGTAGVYWPWAAEGNIDAGLHPLQKPAVLGHELAHAYGFGDEGTCSFWAYLAAGETRDPLLRYSLELSYWRQIAGLLRYADPENYLQWRQEKLDPGIRNDLQAIYDNGELYQDLAPVLRDATYSAYLKAQGIHEGLLNYGRVVELVEGYRRANPVSSSR